MRLTATTRKTNVDTTTIIILVGVAVAMTALRLRYRRFDLRNAALPLGLAAFLGYRYVLGAPTTGSDMDLYLIGGTAGVTLGLLAGTLTSLRPDARAGGMLVKGSLVSAGIFLALIAARLGFAYYAEHGGYAQVRQFCIDHAITSRAAIEAALMLPVVTNVLVRLGLVLARVSYVSVRSGSVRPAFAR
jgi:hypothetical protein